MPPDAPIQMKNAERAARRHAWDSGKIYFVFLHLDLHQGVGIISTDDSSGAK